jgi:dihydrofolate reductase
MSPPFDLLLGRKTYDVFASYWPHKSSDDPAARVLNRARKYVVSHEPMNLDWEGLVHIHGDIVSEIAKLKNQDGPPIQVHGSSNLVQTLLANDLVDELWLKYSPSLWARASACSEKEPYLRYSALLSLAHRQVGSSLPRTSETAKSDLVLSRQGVTKPCRL